VLNLDDNTFGTVALRMTETFYQWTRRHVPGI